MKEVNREIKYPETLGKKWWTLHANDFTSFNGRPLYNALEA